MHRKYAVLIKFVLNLGKFYCIMKHGNYYYKGGTSLKNKKHKDNIGGNKINHVNEALTITVKYGIFGVLWIVLTDLVLSFIAEDTKVCLYFQTAKGWLYVAITMIFIYILIQNRMKLIQKRNNQIIQAYEKLKLTNQELIALDKELQYQKILNQNIIDVAPVVICVWNADGKIIEINPYGLMLFEYGPDEIINKNWVDLLISEEDRPKAIKAIEEIKNSSSSKNYEIQFTTRKGETLYLLWSTSALKRKNNEFVSIGVDITGSIKYQENIKYMAFYDKLTGLPNKTFLELEVDKLISGQADSTFAIAYIDIDNFKYINETFGHQAGDKFLEYIGNVFKSRIKKPNLAARISGDKFAIVVTDFGSAESIIEYIESLKQYLGKTWTNENYRFFVSISAGIVQFPENGEDINTLLKNAEIAMYTAKQQGKNQTLIYKDDMQNKNEWHINMANKIQVGLDNQEFMLYYQPQYNLKTNEIIGLEALIRWNHQNEGFISPAEFISVAEITGQIFKLEHWIFETALKQKQALESLGLENIVVSVNLSAKTLNSPENFEKIEIVLDSFDVDYTKVCIEITETAIISNVDMVIERLNRLTQRGIKIALDDFGTGYSSLTYLKQLPIDIIKLDRDFIKLISSCEKTSVIVKSIITLARDLDYKVIAEGIETTEQAECLKKYNCESGQGFLLCKPIPSEQVVELLSETVLNAKDNNVS